MPDTEITIIVEGELEDVPARSFVQAAQNFLILLRDLDINISHRSQGSIRWVIGKLHKGSPAEFSYRAVIPTRGTDYGAEIIRDCFEGLESLSEGKRPPTAFRQRALTAARNLASVRSHAGIKSVRMQSNGRSMTITAKIVAGVDELLQQSFEAVGSIEGFLETFTVHDQRMFRVYDAIYNRGIECFFTPEVFQKVDKEIKLDDLPVRVIVTGHVRSDPFGKPEAMKVSQMRVFPKESDLPTPSQMRGIAKGMTEGQKAEDYLRKIREGE